MYKLTWVLLAIAGQSAAQSVSGWVKDESHAPLAGATVENRTSGKTMTADHRGFFEFDKTDSAVFEFRFQGYKTEVKSLAKGVHAILLAPSAVLTEDVVVRATRVSELSPTAFVNVSKSEIAKQNFGQDLPILLNFTPSVVTTSDAGAGVGYTNMRIRGSDPSRTNATINGIPLNDAEEQGVFWVDIPDMASSSQSIQIQRGVGSSTNGAGAFGASVNLQTTTHADKPYGDLIASVGSFGTRRLTTGGGTGLLNRFAFDARLSKITSNGYIDRASSDLQSYYLSGGYYGEKTIIRALLFGGKEITYQSWYGVPQSRLENNAEAMNETAKAEEWNKIQTQNLLHSGRTFNAYTYPNQIDNYAQDHAQLHLSRQFSKSTQANLSLHSTRGLGYFEEYRYDDKFSKYGLGSVQAGNESVKASDLVRRRWLDNIFIGTTASVNHQFSQFKMILGGGWNRYAGDHYGQIIWAKIAPAPNDYNYYFNRGQKWDGNIYWKTTWEISNQLSAFTDFQYRRVTFAAGGTEDKVGSVAIDAKFNFFNPKAGLSYQLSEGSDIYLSFAAAHREPVRSDYFSTEGAAPSSERLMDWEGGYRTGFKNVTFKANAFYMRYQNQLAPIGKLNDVGNTVRVNVPKSYRAGLELEGSVRLSKKFAWQGNISLSDNRILDYTETLQDFGDDFSKNEEKKFYYRRSHLALSPAAVGASGFSFYPVPQVECAWLSKYVGKQYLDNTSNENRAIKPYWVNDLRFSWQVKPSFLKEFTIGLLVNNIFNEMYSSNGYTWGYFSGAKEERQNYFFPQAGRNFLAMMSFKF